MKNNILYSKQFGFQKGHSRYHAVIHLIDQINNNFENNEFAIGVFIDHRILLKKLIHYGVNGNNIHWFESYLKIVNNSYFLITKTQILQILPVEFPKDQ